MERSKWCFPDAQPHNRANAENEHQTDGIIFFKEEINTEILHIWFWFVQNSDMSVIVAVDEGNLGALFRM